MICLTLLMKTETGGLFVLNCDSWMSYLARSKIRLVTKKKDSHLISLTKDNTLKPKGGFVAVCMI